MFKKKYKPNKVILSIFPTLAPTFATLQSIMLQWKLMTTKVCLSVVPPAHLPDFTGNFLEVILGDYPAD